MAELHERVQQLLIARAVEVPKTDAWHQQLLRQSASVGVISTALADELRDYLGFRHFFVHGYGFMLSEAPLVDLAGRLPDIWARFRAEVKPQLKT